MNVLNNLYRGSLSLLNDLYQLTMAYSYWTSGNADKEAVFQLSFRTAPFGGHYALACGLEWALDYIRGFRFNEEDVAWLKTLTAANGERLFPDDFLEYLQGMVFTYDLDAVPEATVVFPHEPVLRLRGSLLQCQLLETPLLNLINFQTLVATKASRIRLAAGNDVVSDFGLRRAQGIDGGMAASRAAYVGGMDSTSNVLAGKLLGIPANGTHAHSWVMSFSSETEAFDAYVDAMPHNAVLLVDTYDTLEGVRHAIASGRRLRDKGYELSGIRLDSGDLAALSHRARQMLDEAGFEGTRIVASSEMDEYRIAELKDRGAPIDIWGVGTRLVTAYDEPALDGVFKLAAVRDPGGDWRHRIKLSDDRGKTTSPGLQQIRRYAGEHGYTGDVIYDELLGPPGGNPRCIALHGEREWTIPRGSEGEDLLVPVLRGGGQVYDPPALEAVRERGLREVAAFGEATLENYPVGLEPSLHRRREELIQRVKKG